jgi:hypothetical protein
MFPFIQCHQTRGRAEAGGFWKPCFNGSGEVWLHVVPQVEKRRKRISDKGVFLAVIMFRLDLVGYPSTLSTFMAEKPVDAPAEA